VSLKRLRSAAAVLWVAGIAGMIVSSIRGNNNGWVVLSGFVTVLGSLAVLVGSAIANRQPIEVFNEARAEQLETSIARLVSAGADEGAVRSLVRQAIRLSRQ
jgi:hypothetical protein